MHALEPEFGEGGIEDQQTAGDDGATVGRQARQLDVLDAIEFEELVADAGKRRVGDGAAREFHRARDLADGLDRARRAVGFLPAEAAVTDRELLELGGDFGLRFLPALLRQFAVGEEAARGSDAAHLQAFAFQRGEIGADDEFGRTAADVHHQPALAARRMSVRDAEVDQSRFFAAGDDFDVVAQRGFRRHQEMLRQAQLAHRIGGDGAHARRRDGGQALAEARKAIECALQRFFAQAAAAVKAFGEAHVFLDAIDDAQLAEQVTRDHHVEAVRADVHRGQQVSVLQRGRAGRRHGQRWQILASRAPCAE